MQKTLSALRVEKNSQKLWCGPTLIARALGISYTEAEQKYREANPVRYGQRKNIIWTFWHETVKILHEAGKLLQDSLDWGWVAGVRGRYTTLRRWIDTAKFGWYAVRTSGHVQIVQIDWRGAFIYDNGMEAPFVPGLRGYSKKRCTNVLPLKF